MPYSWSFLLRYPCSVQQPDDFVIRNKGQRSRQEAARRQAVLKHNQHGNAAQLLLRQIPRSAQSTVKHVAKGNRLSGFIRDGILTFVVPADPGNMQDHGMAVRERIFQLVLHLLTASA